MKTHSHLQLLLGCLLTFALMAAACGDDGSEPVPAPTTAAGAEDGGAMDEVSTDDDGVSADDGATDDEVSADDDVAADAAGDDAVEAAASADDAADNMSLAGTVVQILGPETGAEGEGFLAAFAPFEERTGIDIQYTATRDATTELNLALEAGDPPDIVIIPQPGRIVQFGESGDAVAIPQSILDKIGGAYDPFWFDLASTGGVVYGVPAKGSVKSLVWYSPQVFADNGYEIPQSWAELTALVEQIKADGNVPWCVGIESGDATGWAFTDWMEDVMLRLHGPDVYDQWVSNEMPFNDPRVIEVAEFVGEMWFTEGNVLGGRDLIAATGFKEAALPVAEGHCVLHRQANFAGSYFIEIGVELGPDGDVNVFYLPTISNDFGTVVLGAGDHAVGFTDKPETLATLEYIGTAEFADTRILADKGGFLSPNRDHDTSLYSSDFDRTLAEILVSADPFRFDASDLMPGEVGAGEFWRSGTDYVSGAKTVEEFVEDVQDAWPS